MPQSKKQEILSIVIIFIIKYNDIKLWLDKGVNVIQVIKEVREAGGYGIAQAKNIVDRAPGIVIQNQPKEKVEDVKKKLMDVGATVEVFMN